MIVLLFHPDAASSYAIARKGAQVHNGSAWAAWDDASIDGYDIGVTDAGGGWWNVAVPDDADRVELRLRVASSPAVSDPAVWVWQAAAGANSGDVASLQAKMDTLMTLIESRP